MHNVSSVCTLFPVCYSWNDRLYTDLLFIWQLHPMSYILYFPVRFRKDWICINDLEGCWYYCVIDHRPVYYDFLQWLYFLVPFPVHCHVGGEVSVLYPIFIPRCIVCNAVFLIAKPSVCLSICHMHKLWQNEQKFCRHPYTIGKENPSTFSYTKNHWWGTPSSTWNFGSNWPTQHQKRRFLIDIRSYRLSPYT